MRIPKDNQIAKPLQELAEEWADMGPLLTVFGRKAVLHQPVASQATDDAPAQQSLSDASEDPACHVVIMQHGTQCLTEVLATNDAQTQADVPPAHEGDGATGMFADSVPCAAGEVRRRLCACTEQRMLMSLGTRAA